MVKGKKRVEDEKGNISFVETGKMIRGDKLTEGGTGITVYSY
jgi:hypothetical protein